MLSPFLKKLLFARQFSHNEGKFEVLGQRNLMLDPNFIVEVQASSNKDNYTFARKTAIKAMEHYNKLLAIKTDPSYSNLIQLIETFGFGDTSILKFDKTSAIINVKNSVIAEEHLKQKKGGKMTCDFLAGFFAGVFSFLTGKNAEAQEVKCLAKRQGTCQFEIKW